MNDRTTGHLMFRVLVRGDLQVAQCKFVLEKQSGWSILTYLDHGLQSEHTFAARNVKSASGSGTGNMPFFGVK